MSSTSDRLRSSRLWRRASKSIPRSPNRSRSALVAEPSAAEVNVLADEEGLHTILSNLIDNAVKYTQESGTIIVRWRRR